MGTNELKQYEEANPHPVFSAIIDMYLIEMYFGAITSFFMYFIRTDNIENIFVATSLSLLIIIVIYHARFANKILWLSPGEMIGGKSIYGNSKIWANPYGINRIGLFAICVIALLSFRDSNAIAGDLASMEEIVVLLIKAIIVTCGIVLIGKGKLKGIAAFNIIYLLMFVMSLFINDDLVKFNGYFALGTLVVMIIVGVIYHYKRVTK